MILARLGSLGDRLGEMLGKQARWLAYLLTDETNHDILLHLMFTSGTCCLFRVTSLLVFLLDLGNHVGQSFSSTGFVLSNGSGGHAL